MTLSAIRALTMMASDQFGVLTINQATNAGVSPSQIKRMVAAGLLARPHPGVLCLTAVPSTWDQRLNAALLHAGESAFASHRGAARAWDLEGSQHWPVVLTVPPGHRRRPRDVVIYESVDLDPVDTTRRRGLRLATPTRTLIDLGAEVSEAALEVALDDALRRRLTTLPMLHEAIERLARPGRRGARHLRALLEQRAQLDGWTDTGFETRMLRILRAGGLPTPQTQVAIYQPDGRFVMRVDMAYSDHLVGIEADSAKWHMDRARFEADRAKRSTAESLGWTILAFTHRQVKDQPDFVAETVARTLNRRGPAFLRSRSA